MYICGLDLGQAADYSALDVLDYQPQTAVYHCGYLQRLPLNMPYPQQVGRVYELLATPPLRGHTRLVLDATGVGRPVLDLVRSVGLAPIPVLITGGDVVHYD